MKKPTGTEKFNLYFNEVYKERWPNLKEAMCQPEKQVVRFCFNSLELEENKKFQPHEIEWLKNCIWYDSKVHFGLNNQLSQQAKRTLPKLLRDVVSLLSLFEPQPAPIKDKLKNRYRDLFIGNCS